MSRDMWK